MQAEQKYIRISPRKIRLVVNSIKHLTPVEAILALKFMNKSSSLVVSKTIKQAVANATNNHGAEATTLRFDSIQVNSGATYKRFRAVSRGRGHSVFKRTSHIKIFLKSINSTITPTVTSKTETKTKR
jgi:large subunit ribosomal protein L22